MKIPFLCQIISVIFSTISILSGVISVTLFFLQLNKNDTLLAVFFYIRLTLALPPAFGILILNHVNCICGLFMLPLLIASVFFDILSLPCLKDKRKLINKLMLMYSCSKLIFDGFVLSMDLMQLICAPGTHGCTSGPLTSQLGIWFVYATAIIDSLSFLAMIGEIIWQCCLSRCYNEQTQCLECFTNFCRNFWCCFESKMIKKYEEGKSEAIMVNI